MQFYLIALTTGGFITMGLKFKIIQQYQSNNLHLRLTGNFNDASICDLIDILKTNISSKVIVHTDSLNNIAISSFGKDVFFKNLNKIDENLNRIQFTGISASEFIPGECAIH